MTVRLIQAALWRKRGMVALAVLAVAIGGSVAGALLHVSHDISYKLTRELRSLGPNLLLLPAESARHGFMEEELAGARLREAGLEGVALLFLTAQIDGRPVPIVGADLEAVRRLHPSWKVEGDAGASMIGARLARRLGVSPGATLRATFAGADDPRTLEWRVGARFESGGADDEAWWIPLAQAQTLAGRPRSISLVQARLSDPGAAQEVVRALEAHGDVRAQVLHALSSTEATLLERTRRLMAMVTIGVLLAAGLCALGTLTDLALERRREIALLKALGARRRDVAAQFGAESLVVGVLGGMLGWWMGVAGAQVIGREVFRSGIAIRWEVFPAVLAISIGVALIASIGPIQLALRVDPAPVLRGE